jgi:hypothetical protein
VRAPRRGDGAQEGVSEVNPWLERAAHRVALAAAQWTVSWQRWGSSGTPTNGLLHGRGCTLRTKQAEHKVVALVTWRWHGVEEVCDAKLKSNVMGAA